MKQAQTKNRELAEKWWYDLTSIERQLLTNKHFSSESDWNNLIADDVIGIWEKEKGNVAGDSFIVDGMKVRHHLLNGKILTVVADEKGPAYTGNDFADDEISLSMAIQEWKSGNLGIASSIGVLDGVFAYDGNESENYTIFRNGKKILELFSGEDEAKEIVSILNSAPALKEENDRLKERNTELLEALKEITEMALQWSVKGLTPTIFKAQKAIESNTK